MPVERSGPRGLMWFALAVCVAHFASFEPFTRPIVTDVRYFLYYAWQVAEGAVPHLDFFENKPQLPVFVGALLYRIGATLGVDPIYVIRLGFLSIATTGGLLHFFIFRRLGRGDARIGLLGVLAYCSFGLIGVLPATGPISKLSMAVLASAMALLVHDQRWFWAGVVGALAFLDWQIGAAAWLAAALTALLCADRRRPAFLSVTAGGVAGLAPILMFYAANGALRATFEQVIVSTLFRGGAALAASGLADRLVRIGRVAAAACPEQLWLFFASFLGVGVCAYWLLKTPDRDLRRLLTPLCLFHGVLTGFSLVDFQAYGDMYALLHSVAFLLGMTWAALYRTGSELVTVRFGERARRYFQVALVLVAFLCARPAWLRPRIEIATESAAGNATLADQREVAAAVSDRVGDGTFVAMDSSELLFLMQERNPLPNVYWGRAVYAYYRASETEPPIDTVTRLLRSVDPDVFVAPRRLARTGWLPEGYTPLDVHSKNGSYAVSLRVR